MLLILLERTKCYKYLSFFSNLKFVFTLIDKIYFFLFTNRFGKTSAFLFFPNEIIFNFLNFAFSKKLKNLSSRLILMFLPQLYYQ